MKSFNLYEFAGLLIPSAVFLIGISVILPELELWKFIIKTNIAGVLANFSIFIIFAFVIGQILQAVGGIFQDIFWWDT